MRWDEHVACTDKRKNKYRVWWKYLKKETTWEFYTCVGEKVDMERADWNNMVWDRDMWRAV
jgi:hypothetical protein